MTRVVATGCTHGVNLPDIPEGDFFLYTGDASSIYEHKFQEQSKYFKGTFGPWLQDISAENKVGIAGNHDGIAEQNRAVFDKLDWHYLQDEVLEVGGLKIWGSPMSPTFNNWYFMRDDKGLGELWETIPRDVDILLIHGPMYGVGDRVDERAMEQKRDPNVGSQTLRNRFDYVGFPNLKLFVFSHIHEAYGIYDYKGVKMVNASHVNFDYEPTNPPLVVEL